MGLVVLAVTTVAEGLGLAFWLHDANNGNFVRGLIWLFAGEAIEVGVFIAFLFQGPATERNRSAVQVIARLTVIAVFEFFVWIVWWYAMQAIGTVGGIVVLLVLMHLKHDADVAAISDTRHFRTLFTPKGVTATGLEVLGAMVCYALVASGQFWPGTGILLACITVEHFVGNLIVNEALAGRHFLTRNPAWTQEGEFRGAAPA